MDFVDWCGIVLAKAVEMTRSDPEAIRRGEISESMLSTALFGEEIRNSPDYHTSSYRHSIIEAMQELDANGLLDYTKKGQMHCVRGKNFGRQVTDHQISFWQMICATKLDDTCEKLLRLVNNLSEKSQTDHACTEGVERAVILSQWDEEENLLRDAARELDQIGFIKYKTRVGGQFWVNSRYAGLVWGTRRSLTVQSVWIDKLVSDWETTNVDFKRELKLDTASQKAEFIKDILGLATTQASGQRFMVLGFENEQHSYYGPPSDDITQERLEQLLREYTEPLINVKYSLIDYRLGTVGCIEVSREPAKLPYSVAKPVGEKPGKRIEKGQIFVRHGTLTEPPTEGELRALYEEAERARLHKAYGN